MNNKKSIKKIFSLIIIAIVLTSVAAFLPGCSYGIDFDKKSETQTGSTVEPTAPEAATATNAVSDGTANPGKTSVNIGSLQGPTSIGMIKLHEEKPPLSDDVTANYDIIPNPEVMVSKLLSGEIDIATLPTNVAAKLYNKGLDYKLAAITGYGVLYILATDTQVKSWEDLKGKKINVISKGSTPDVALRFLMEKNGLETGADIELDYTIAQVELSQMMIAGKADLAILPEPFVTMVLDKNPDTFIAFDIEQEWKKVQDGSPMPMSCVVVKSGLADNNMEAVETFLNLYEESIDWVNSNVAAASELVEKNEIGMDAKTAQQAIPRCNIKFTDISQAKEIVQDYLQTILDFSPEDVGGKIPDENFYF